MRRHAELVAARTSFEWLPVSGVGAALEDIRLIGARDALA